jgi:hypothetical protein
VYVFDGHKYELIFKEEKADFYKVSMMYSGDLGVPRTCGGKQKTITLYSVDHGRINGFPAL